MYDEDGRIVAVYPETQIVEWIFACLTAGFTAPGVTDAIGIVGPVANPMVIEEKRKPAATANILDLLNVTAKGYRDASQMNTCDSNN